ncbi:energy transducer TonB [Nitrosophilus kaiyonis]|uniref:energy transducer TonB n=1 Tax=Nitrosophilus kaiyonis TaxID=2930200 RepID=UPI002490534C|nr:energy transducer TonB [Nitrosophilus kaiyonis]
MKKRYYYSFFITLIIYILIFSIFFINFKNVELPKFQREKITKLNIKNFKISPLQKKHTIKKIENKKEQITKKKIKQVNKKTKKIEKISKNSKILKKDQNITKKIAISKKKEHKKIPKKRVKTFKKVTKKEIKKIKTKKVVKKEPKKSKNSLYSFLKKPDIPSLKDIGKSIKNDEIRALYKDEFDSFTIGQKEFIKNNLSLIGKITQKYLTLRGYPDFAVKTRQEGVNIVEFYLHPNGDITDLKIIKSSGYKVLDENSIETIKTAYKDYPRPKETTKIRIYVHYKIIY